MGFIVLFLLIIIPVYLTGYNIIAFVKFMRSGKDSGLVKFAEAVTILLGWFFFALYVGARDIIEARWSEQLYNDQLHFMLSLDHMPIAYIMIGAAVIGYILLRYIPTVKLPPLVLAFGMAGIYVGVAFCVLLFIQMFFDIFVAIYLFNCVLILLKTVCIVVKRRNAAIQSGEHPTKFKRLAVLFDGAVGLPILAFLALIPLLGVLLAVMTLFGQEPSAAIKLWTETADWTFSQRIPPQNIYMDLHYLCTVAAGGHRKVVKPQRTGIRHGHRIVVNRQLCIANAFEEVIAQRTPRFHKFVRTVYDNTGYPIAKHIRSKFVADAVYFLMKPLEWLFLLVLYTFCAHPEDRIAVQYPHAPLPKAGECGGKTGA